MNRPTYQLIRRILLWIGSAATAVIVLLPFARSLRAADDTDLLRDKGGTPFVMVLLDTSSSMTLTPPDHGGKDFGNATPANGDDTESKIVQVKKALYEVFKNVENVNFGFLSYNQDHLRVQAKHWLYSAHTAATFDSGALKASFPAAANEQWVFGPHLNGSGVAGTCDAPLDLGSDLVKLDRFAKTPSGTTVLWATDKNRTIRFTVERSAATSLPVPGSTTGETVPNVLGSDLFEVTITADLVTSCSPINVTESQQQTVQLSKVTDFLMVETDADNPQPSTGDSGLCSADEASDGTWNWTDVLADGTCGSGASGPFTGRGGEANTDSGARASYDFRDQCCVDPAAPGECMDLSGIDDLSELPGTVTCYNTRFPTTIDPKYPELDFGDQIPMDWKTDYREEFLKRLNPRHPEYDDAATDDTSSFYDPAMVRRYFGAASYFADRPNSDGILHLKSEDERPLIAFGQSPLSRALNDIRCWVLGANDGQPGKCNGPQFETGWNSLFQQLDLWYACRVPYLLVVTDGESNSTGENESADVASFFSAAGIRTFVFSFNKTNTVNSLVGPGKGEYIPISNGNDFKDKLEQIIGQIKQDQARTFASAAVPSIQSTSGNNIFLTNFRPLSSVGIWEGHLQAFERPITTSPPDSSDPNFRWDAAVELLAQAPDMPTTTDGTPPDLSSVDLQLGSGADQRRIYYSEQLNPEEEDLDSWPANRRAFNRTTEPSGPEIIDEPLEPDFWKGLMIPFDSKDETSVTRARDRANSIVENVLIERHNPAADDPDVTGTPLDPYILGDIFHSDPLIVSSPPNTRYFALDAEETRDSDGNQIGTGYQEFFNRHENRRKVVITGSNDGMLHAFDAGRAATVDFVDQFKVKRRKVDYNDGSGREVWAYIPRQVLPTIKGLAENPKTHRWMVDGPPVAGDVFIDPAHAGTPDPANREWRSVVIGGLREGGSGYYALDITQPDPLVKDYVGPTDPDPEFDPFRRDIFIPSSSPSSPAGIVPACSGKGTGGLGCDEDVPYPAPLWEFNDQVWDPSTHRWISLDEDQNEFVDLGESWSAPDIGRIKVIEDGVEVNKYVAIFGGGLDPAKGNARGNWLYMVDIETGQPIYKRELDGSAPSNPAAVDTDQDGFIDRVYIGTTAGHLYRLDLTIADSSGNKVVPTLTQSRQALGMDGLMHSGITRFAKGSGTKPLWQPRQIFDADGRPIYFPPAVIFVANLGEYALAFGTGERDNLTAITEGGGRFYVFVDDTDNLSDTDLPMHEDRFTQVDLGSGDHSDLLTDPNGKKGWFLPLANSERLIGDPFAFSGVTFFATYEPEKPQPSCDITSSNCTNPLCSLTGDSRVYVVGTTDADAFIDNSGILQRYFSIQDRFVTSPFTEQVVGRSDGDGSSSDTPEDDPLTETELKLEKKLMELFPDKCKFGNQRIDVKVIRDDTQLERIAPVPICIIEKNWKEIDR